MTKEQGFVIIRFLIVAILSVALFWFTGWLFAVSYPFWIATALVWMFFPVIRFLRQKVKLPSSLAVLTVLLTGLSTIVAIFIGIVFLIIIGVRGISGRLQTWIETVSVHMQNFFNESILPLWQQITGFMDLLTKEQQNTLQGGITQIGSQLAQMLGEVGQKIIDALTQLIIAVPTFLITFLFIFLAFYFIGKDWDRIGSKMRDSIPRGFIENGIKFKNMFRFRVVGFLKAQIIIMLIATLVVLIGLLVLRIEQAFTIAAVVGIAEILPYLGSGTILIPWSIYSFLTGDISLGIGLAVVYGVTVIVRQSVEPKVLSSSMNLNALAVLISLFVGLQIFGIIGVFLGPFILVVLVIMTDIGVINAIKEFILKGWKEEITKN